MRVLFIAAILALLSSCQEESATGAKALHKSAGAESQALPDELKDPEDCDDKEPVVPEEPEEVSLGGGDAGCTIE